jgi:phytoene synthase
MISVDQSYEYCLRVARTRAKNFYYSFVLLSRQQRKAMCAIYAFMRYCDDLSDEPGASRAAVQKWRGELEDALEGRFSDIRCGRRSTTQCGASAFRTSISGR